MTKPEISRTSVTQGIGYAVFADILGFGAATLSLPDDIQLPDATKILRRQRLFLRYPQHDLIEGAADTWLRALVLFPLIMAHGQCLLDDVDGARACFRALFSDCAYLLFRDHHDAFVFCSYIAGAALWARVPLRIGVAHGGFLCFNVGDLQWSREYNNQIADRRLWRFLRNSRLAHTSRFVGSAFTRAYKAESCGLKGMRVFVHNSVVHVIQGGRGALIPIPNDELSKLNRNHSVVGHELCWPAYLATWKLRARDPQPREWLPLTGQTFGSNLRENLVSDIERWCDPEGRAKAQYDATYGSLERLAMHMEDDAGVRWPGVYIPGPDEPISEVAEALGLSHREVRRQLIAGTLRGSKIRGRWTAEAPHDTVFLETNGMRAALGRLGETLASKRDSV
jgi:hypothetical protein